MQASDPQQYIARLAQHYQHYFGVEGKKAILDKGPREKLHPDFYLLEIPPNKRHNAFIYCTVGMSADRTDDNLIELFVLSPKADQKLVELLTYCASYHRTGRPLNIHHTVNVGQPWLDNSVCDHAFISLPYLDEDDLQLFNFGEHAIHCYWLIPITRAERDYKVENGCEALEQLFEEKELDYLNPARPCLTGK
ncbi:suppressor of fused domain protein [Chitinophaga varians]|uniref:suppressor of fused domain protein n=1 Tax=Chitinophaga varians TaxID=2202339 RepID=UPI00165F3A7E|nr:suppressor of fused domain protein [Chitinophaga varians]MBC9911123.1 suppressor of fused domain protein [Chitinophaga varians]